MTKNRKIPIKVCGITDPENMAGVAALMPDFMGFIFHPPSPRDVTGKIEGLPLEQLPDNIIKVAVMVNKPLQEAMDIVRKYGFDMVQLHGAESPEVCREIRRHVQVIKAFSITDKLPPNLNNYTDSCDYFLFDTKGLQPGGNGIPFDHSVLRNYDGKKPFFLSGGIDPEFTIHPEEYAGLFALDINSRFETSPGIKDISLLQDFLQ